VSQAWWFAVRVVDPQARETYDAMLVDSRDGVLLDRHRHLDAARAVFPGTPEIRDGPLWPSDLPGLGIDLDEKLAANYLVGAAVQAG
jgi:mannonate dehydratase